MEIYDDQLSFRNHHGLDEITVSAIRAGTDYLRTEETADSGSELANKIDEWKGRQDYDERLLLTVREAKVARDGLKALITAATELEDVETKFIANVELPVISEFIDLRSETK